MDTLGGVVRSLGVIAGLLLSSGVVVPPVMAAFITYDFAGTVTEVDPRLASQFNPSQRLTGFITVNPTDEAPADPTVGGYNIQNFQVTIGTYTATMGNSGSGTVQTLLSPFSSSFGTDVLSPNGNAVNSFQPVGFSIELAGSPGVLTSDALPNPVPSLSSFAITGWRLFFESSGPGENLMNGTLTSLTAVPLPSSVLLFGGGLVALLGLGAGGLRKRRVSQA